MRNFWVLFNPDGRGFRWMLLCERPSPWTNDQDETEWYLPEKDFAYDINAIDVEKLHRIEVLPPEHIEGVTE